MQVPEVTAPPVHDVYTEVVAAGHELAMFARRCGEKGTGPTFVLVHGLGVSGRYMAPLLRRLGKGAVAWAPDLPGFGRSPGPRSVLDMAELAAALDAWMDKVGISRPILVGNSMGCQVVTRLAIARPDRVAAIVLIAPTMDRTAGGKWRQILRWLLNAMREPPSMVWLAIGDYLRAGFRRTWRTLALAHGEQTWCQYGDVRCPGLVVRGERDPIVSQGWAKRVAGSLPSGRLVVIAQAAHAVHYERPSLMALTLQDFAAGLPPGRPGSAAASG